MSLSASSRLCRIFAAALLAAPSICAAASPEAGSQQQEQLGDALLLGVPLAALALTFWLDDAVPSGDDGAGASGAGPAGAAHLDSRVLTRMNGSPRHDLALAMGRTLAATYGLKYSVDETRPNGDPYSFPSAHAAVTFAGAEFIRKEYGWDWGVPAYLAAGFVGFSRVQAEEHYTHDVLVGAAIGILSNYDFAHLKIPFGALTVGPMLNVPAMTAVAPAYDAPADPAIVAPGLRFKLSF